MPSSRLSLAGLALLCLATLIPLSTSAMGLEVQPMKGSCKATPTLSQPAQVPLPSAAQQRIPQSQAVAGQNTVAWVWLGSPTHRYPHTALGSTVHAASVHAIVRPLDGPWREVAYELPLHRVFEDRVPRLVDLDQDGQDEILLIEADALRGASLVVLKVSPDQQLVEWARGPYAGSTFRWLNPAGVADFDGDGQLDIASVTTPHIGGTLILHHVQPPHLLPFAKTMDVSNHRMGALEQDLAVIVQRRGVRPTIIVPDMTRRALHALRWEAPGQWKELADLMPMPDRIDRLTPMPGGACAMLSNGTAHRVTLTH
jgi:hypothetical protein